MSLSFQRQRERRGGMKKLMTEVISMMQLFLLGRTTAWEEALRRYSLSHVESTRGESARLFIRKQGHAVDKPQQTGEQRGRTNICPERRRKICSTRAAKTLASAKSENVEMTRVSWAAENESEGNLSDSSFSQSKSQHREEKRLWDLGLLIIAIRREELTVSTT